MKRVFFLGILIVFLFSCKEQVKEVDVKKAAPVKKKVPKYITAEEVESQILNARGKENFKDVVLKVENDIAKVKDEKLKKELLNKKDSILLDLTLSYMAIPERFSYLKPLFGKSSEFEYALSLINKLNTPEAKKLVTYLTVLNSIVKNKNLEKLDPKIVSNMVRTKKNEILKLRIRLIKEVVAIARNKLSSIPEGKEWEGILKLFSNFFTKSFSNFILTFNKNKNPFLDLKNELFFCPRAQEILKSEIDKKEDEILNIVMKNCNEKFFSVYSNKDLKYLYGSSNIIISEFFKILNNMSNRGYIKEKDLIDLLMKYRHSYENRFIPISLPYSKVALESKKNEKKEKDKKDEKFEKIFNLSSGTYFESLPIELVTVDKEGVYVTTRPLLYTKNGIIKIKQLGDSTKPVVLLKDFKQILKDKKNLTKSGGIKIITDKITEVNKEVKKIVNSMFVQKNYNVGKRILFYMKDQITPKNLAIILKSIRDAGISSVFYPIVNKAYMQVAPSVYKKEKLDLAKNYKRPVIVNLSSMKYIEVFPPALPQKGVKKGKPAVKLAKGVKVIRDRKKRLFKFMVKFDDRVLDNLKNVLTYTKQLYNGDNYILLTYSKRFDSRLIPFFVSFISDSVSDKPLMENSKVFDSKAVECKKGYSCVGNIVEIDPELVVPRLNVPVKVVEEKPVGFCEQSNIKTVVTARMGAIKFCYEKMLPLKPDLKGKLVLKWTIDTDGSVSDIGVLQDTLKDKKVKRCIFKIIRKLKFDKPQGGICIVRWPFVFK